MDQPDPEPEPQPEPESNLVLGWLAPEPNSDAERETERDREVSSSPSMLQEGDVLSEVEQETRDTAPPVRDSRLQDVLRELDLIQYEDKLAQCGVLTLDQLSVLSKDDLERMDIANVPRVKIWGTSFQPYRGLLTLVLTHSSLPCRCRDDCHVAARAAATHAAAAGTTPECASDGAGAARLI